MRHWPILAILAKPRGQQLFEARLASPRCPWTTVRHRYGVDISWPGRTAIRQGALRGRHVDGEVLQVISGLHDAGDPGDDHREFLQLRVRELRWVVNGGHAAVRHPAFAALDQSASAVSEGCYQRSPCGLGKPPSSRRLMAPVVAGRLRKSSSSPRRMQ